MALPLRVLFAFFLCASLVVSCCCTKAATQKVKYQKESKWNGYGMASGTPLQEWPCGTKSHQQWTVVATANNSVNILDSDNKCIDIEAWNMNDGAKVQIWDCHPDDRPENQRFKITPQGQIVSVMSGKCLTVTDAKKDIGTRITMHSCQSGSASQIWKYDSASKTFVSVLSNLCLDAGGTYTCQDEPIKAMAFCNWTLPVHERVKDLVSRMTAEELYSQMGNTAPSIPRLAIPSYEWWTECLHGVNSRCGTNCPTSFPNPSALGATFNMTLIHKMAQAISTEARALYVEGVVGLDFWAPNININRDPRWGRNMEVPGEDPMLNARYASNFIRGLQEGFDPHYVKVVGTCKHYAAYSLEDWKGVDRFHFDALVSDYDLVETYLPAWKGCVVDGRARSIMCSYNSVNGIPACADSFLLQDILRDSFGFDGYVVSDCDAVDCIQSTHNYTQDPADTCKVAVQAGTDLNCGSFYQKNMNKALEDKKVTVDELKKSVSRLFKQRFELGMWDPPSIQPYLTIPPSAVDSSENNNLALEAARQSIVLLKNEKKLLPLSKDIATIAVIGPNAYATETLLGNYYGQRCHDGSYDCVLSPLKAIMKKVPKTTVLATKGCGIIENDTSDFGNAVKFASDADVVIMIMGINTTVESEGHDRLEINLPGVQEKLIKTVHATGTPVVLVLLNGGAVSVDWEKDNIPAIVEAWYAGENAAMAIADVLFGDFNPGGKLPVTIFQQDYVNLVPLTDMNMRASKNNPGRSYRYYTGPAPLWEFGFGLSYTTFNITWRERPQVNLFQTNSKQSVYFRVTVQNTGNITGDETVMAFITRESTQDGPLKQMFDFQKVTLVPGQSVELFFAFSPDTVAVASGNGAQKVIKEGKYQIEVGVGPDKLVHPFKVAGEPYFYSAY